MPVTKQLVPIPLAGGIDTKSDSKQVPQGKLLELENGVFTKNGELRKRPGLEQIPMGIDGGGTVGQAIALDTFLDEMVAYDGAALYSRRAAADLWVNRGPLIAVDATTTPIVHTSTEQQLDADVAECSAITAYAWDTSDTGPTQASIIDTTTGATIAQGTVAGSASPLYMPKLITDAATGRIFLLGLDAGGRLEWSQVDTASPSLSTGFPTGAALVTNVSTVPQAGYDACAPANGSGLIFVAYMTSTPTIVLLACHWSGSALTILSTTVVEATGANVYTAAGPSCVAVSTDGTNVWVMWGTGAAVRFACYTCASTPVLVTASAADIGAVRAQRVACVPTSATTLLFFVEVYGTHVLRVGERGSATITRDLVRGVGLASKAWRTVSGLNSGYVFVVLSYESALQSSYFTLAHSKALATSFVVARTSSGLGGGHRESTTLSEVVRRPTNPEAYLFAAGQKGALNSEANVVFSLVGVAGTALDFSSSVPLAMCTQSRNLLIATACPQSYDGLSPVEHGFHLYPEGVTATPGGVDGFLDPGSYEYAVTYEWSDRFGQRQRSAPSVATPVVVAATNHVSVVVPTLRLTRKVAPRTPVSIVIYRTAANGNLFHRVTSSVAPLLNDTTVDTLTFVDTLSDADIAANELLYTTGDVLANAPPPACSLAVPFGNRVVLGGLEDVNEIWFSKNRFDNAQTNTIPPEFAAELTIGVDARGGAITALGVLDDKLVIFKESAIFVVTGQGPNDTGGGEIYSDAQLIASDVGCSSAASVVVMPMGLMFMSPKGIYLLDRSLAVQYIGAPVEAYNGMTIGAAVLMPTTNQVVFVGVSAAFESTFALVYDYLTQQWGTWTSGEVNSAGDACLFEDKLHIAAGSVALRESVTYADAGGPYKLAWTSPNLSFAGIGGYQRAFRVYLTGAQKSTHTLAVSVAYDYADAYTQTTTVTPAPVTDELYQYRVDFTRQRCTAVRIHVEDTEASSGEGYAMSAMTFEVGALPGGNRLRQAQIVGGG